MFQLGIVHRVLTSKESQSNWNAIQIEPAQREKRMNYETDIITHARNEPMKRKRIENGVTRLTGNKPFKSGVVF